MPWLSVANPGSRILAIMRRRLPDDWTRRYNITPVLIETFVQTPRYTEAVYKASGWIRVGTKKGRGRYAQEIRQAKKRHLAEASAQVLEMHPQPVKIARNHLVTERLRAAGA